jgi:uncharacterized membrane protein YeaQ/YmgE (transglycosylase-associated protein family)
LCNIEHIVTRERVTLASADLPVVTIPVVRIALSIRAQRCIIRTAALDRIELRSRSSRRDGRTGKGRVYATSALVGIAGSFIGFHIASLLKLSASGSIVPFIAAAVGAAVILWGWRVIRF